MVLNGFLHVDKNAFSQGGKRLVDAASTDKMVLNVNDPG
jgi:hypothetical protein